MQEKRKGKGGMKVSLMGGAASPIGKKKKGVIGV